MKLDIRSVVRMLGSRRLATIGMLSWLLLLVIWVVPFEFSGLTGDQVRDIVISEPFFRIVYVLLLVNTLACIVPGMVSIARRAKRVPNPLQNARIAEDALPVAGPWSQESATGALQKSGFGHHVVGDGWVWGVRNRYSPWGHVALHLGLLVVAAAAAVSLIPGSNATGKAVVVEGETFSSTAGELVDLKPKSATFPDFSFTVKDVTARFHDDLLLFTKLDARIADGSGGQRVLRAGSPMFVDPLTTVSVEEYGYAPEVVISSDTTSSATQVYKLKAFPSGTADYIEFRGMDDVTYNMKVRIYGDYVDRAGTPGSRSFNLRNPRVLVSIWRTRSDQGQTLVVRDALVGISEPVTFAGQSVTFTALREYGFFRISRSLSSPIAAVGLLIVAAGFCLALLLPRQQALIALSDGGQVLVSVRDDVYGKATRTQSRVARMWGSQS